MTVIIQSGKKILHAWENQLKKKRLHCIYRWKQAYASTDAVSGTAAELLGNCQKVFEEGIEILGVALFELALRFDGIKGATVQIFIDP